MIPFNFRLAAQKRRQKHKVPFDPMCWNDDVPRRLWSEDGYLMVATFPKLTDNLGTVSHLPHHLSRTLIPTCVGCHNQSRP